MDIIDRHFAAENAHDVRATLDTYTDDIVWDDVTHPDSPFRGKDQVARVYSSIIESIPDVTLTSVRRFTGEATSSTNRSSPVTFTASGRGLPVVVRRSRSGSSTCSKSGTG